MPTPTEPKYLKPNYPCSPCLKALENHLGGGRTRVVVGILHHTQSSCSGWVHKLPAPSPARPGKGKHKEPMLRRVKASSNGGKLLTMSTIISWSWASKNSRSSEYVELCEREGGPGSILEEHACHQATELHGMP